MGFQLLGFYCTQLGTLSSVLAGSRRKPGAGLSAVDKGLG